MADHLLQTKLYIPTLQPALVPRPRLIARLSAGLTRNLTVVSAPAGFGKTTLLSAWARSRTPRQVAWLSLDADDNDLGRFLTYLIAALEQTEPEIAARLEAVLQATTKPQPKPLLAALLHELTSRPEPLILILDDYHAIHNHDVHETLRFLIDHLLPPNRGGLHLVISGRIEPPLPLARLRVRGQLNEIRPADIRFSLPETTALLNERFSLGLSAEDLGALERRTEGWVASLQLAALSLQDRADKHAFVTAFSGSHHYVIDYLMDEVLADRPDSVRMFLQRTSVLERLCAPLCEALTGLPGSQQILEQLERANLFLVPLDERRQWYRYHHLFADMLRARLQIESPEAVPQLHLRAAVWYAGQNLVADAVHHALAAQDHERAAGWIAEAVTEAFRRGQVSKVRRWLDALPQEKVHSTPMLALAHAWVSVIAMDAQPIDGYLDHLEELVRTARADSPELRAVWLSNVMAIRSTRALHLNQVQAVIEYAEQGLALLSDRQEIEHRLRSVLGYNRAYAYAVRGETTQACHAYNQALDAARQAKHTIIVAFAGYHLGELHRLRGRLRDAIAVHSDALRLVQALAPSSPLQGLMHIGLGAVRCEQFDLAAAQTHLETGVEQCQAAGLAELIAEGQRWLACVYLAQGEADQAREALKRAVAGYGSLTHIEARSRARLCQAQQALDQGDLDALEQWRTSPPRLANASDEIVQAETLIRAQVCLALRKGDQAARLLSQLEAALEQAHVVDPVSVAVLGAQVAGRRGQRAHALRALQRALYHAAREHHVRPFVRAGQAMRELLQTYRAQSAAHRDFVDTLIGVFPIDSPQETKVQPLAEPLSDRELDVLRAMAAGLKYKEIAERLYISVNTVGYHVKNLYGKLGAHNRTQALARARQLALLP